jgi:hypothetical protein
MGCIICNCASNGMNNTGYACVPIFYSTKVIILVPTYKEDGTRNYISSGTTLNQAFFDAKIAATTAAGERWYPLPQLKNVEDTRGDNLYETFDDLSTVFIQEAVRTFKGEITVLPEIGAVSPQLKGTIESARCTSMSAYYVDINGNLIGKYEGGDTTKLYPEQIDSQSLAVKFQKFSLKDKASQKLMLSFNINIVEKDEDYAMVQCSDMNGVTLLTLRGNVDVCADISEIGPEGFIMTTTTNYGTFKNPGYVTGIDYNDFVSSGTGLTSRIYNETDAADVLITDLTESPDGTYSIEFAAQTVGDSLIVNIEKDGFDFSCIADSPVVITVS